MTNTSPWPAPVGQRRIYNKPSLPEWYYLTVKYTNDDAGAYIASGPFMHCCYMWRSMFPLELSND